MACSPPFVYFTGLHWPRLGAISVRVVSCDCHRVECSLSGCDSRCLLLCLRTRTGGTSRPRCRLLPPPAPPAAGGLQTPAPTAESAWLSGATRAAPPPPSRPPGRPDPTRRGALPPPGHRAGVKTQSPSPAWRDSPARCGWTTRPSTPL